MSWDITRTNCSLIRLFGVSCATFPFFPSENASQISSLVLPFVIQHAVFWGVPNPQVHLRGHCLTKVPIPTWHTARLPRTGYLTEHIGHMTHRCAALWDSLITALAGKLGIFNPTHISWPILRNSARFDPRPTNVFDPQALSCMFAIPE